MRAAAGVFFLPFAFLSIRIFSCRFCHCKHNYKWKTYCNLTGSSLSAPTFRTICWRLNIKQLVVHYRIRTVCVATSGHLLYRIGHRGWRSNMLPVLVLWHLLMTVRGTSFQEWLTRFYYEMIAPKTRLRAGNSPPSLLQFSWCSALRKLWDSF